MCGRTTSGMEVRSSQQAKCWKTATCIHDMVMMLDYMYVCMYVYMYVNANHGRLAPLQQRQRRAGRPNLDRVCGSGQGAHRLFQIDERPGHQVTMT